MILIKTNIPCPFKHTTSLYLDLEKLLDSVDVPWICTRTQLRKFREESTVNPVLPWKELRSIFRLSKSGSEVYSSFWTSFA